jgi:photosystem II stability/assembly factor-like uncharacterized protein
MKRSAYPAYRKLNWLPVLFLLSTLFFSCQHNHTTEQKHTLANTPKLWTFNKVSGWNDVIYKLVFKEETNGIPRQGWAIGNYGILIYFNGTTWIDKTLPKVISNLKGISMSRDFTKGWIVGESGRMFYFNGKGWIAQKRIVSVTLFGIAMNADLTQGWSVGESGTLLHYTTKRGWEKQDDVGKNILYDLKMNADLTEGWAIGAKGTLIHYSNGNWVIQKSLKQELNRICMSKDFTKGFITGDAGLLSQLDKGEWKTKKVFDCNLHGIQMNGDGTRAMAVGDTSLVFHYENGNWKKDKKISNGYLRGLWMNADLTYGWISGADGLLIKYQNNTLDQVAGMYLRGIFMDDQLSEGWAVGESGSLMRYENNNWRKYADRYKSRIALRDIRMSQDFKTGWAVGDSGSMRRFNGTYWEKSIKVAPYSLAKIWMNSTLTTGWAVGDHGVMLYYKDGRWRTDSVKTPTALQSVTFNEEGTEGWAVGYSGVFLHYQDQHWKLALQNEGLDLNALWMSKDLSQGWAGSDRGNLYYYNGKDWILQSSIANTTNNIYAIAMSEDGKNGWAVGDYGATFYYNGIVWRDYSPEALDSHLHGIAMNSKLTSGWITGNSGYLVKLKMSEAPAITYTLAPNTDLERLKGSLTITTGAPPTEVNLAVKDKLGINRLANIYYTINKKNDTTFTITFNQSNEALKEIGGKNYNFSALITYSAPYQITEVEYTIDKDMYIGAPKSLWKILLPYSIVFALLLNALLVVLATRFKYIRNIILHPVGANLIGLVVGKYLIIDFLIRFVPVIRIGLFRDYRLSLNKAPFLSKWDHGTIMTYIPPEVSLKGVELPMESPLEYEFEKVLAYICGSPENKNKLWAVIAASGMGKTALLEKWVQQALKEGLTPVLIRLGVNAPPEKEAAALFGQFGEIRITDAVALDLLTQGGFLILLDGFNESKSPDLVHDFLRKVIKENLVILSTQELTIPEGWSKEMHIEHVQLSAFGKKELKNLLAEKDIDELLSSAYLRDLVVLPYSAKLIAQFVKKHGIPRLRLDIYRDLIHTLSPHEQMEYIPMLERKAWALFKNMDREFLPQEENLSTQFCESAKWAGILTRRGDHFRFSHEKIHRYFVSRFIWQNNQAFDIEAWNKELSDSPAKNYWADVVELLGEHFAEPMDGGERQGNWTGRYIDFVKMVEKFNNQLFADRLYPQIHRFHIVGLLKKDLEFIEWCAQKLAAGRNVDFLQETS